MRYVCRPKHECLDFLYIQAVQARWHLFECLNCYRSRRIRPKAKWAPAVSKGCAFEKDLDALKRNLNFHSLRRTATTLLHEAGVPAAVARALIEHDSEAMHQLYVSVGREALEQAAATLPDLV